jgi:hypothetical protein
MYFLFTMVDNPRFVRIVKDPRARKRNLIFRTMPRNNPRNNQGLQRAKGLESAVWWSQTESNRRPHACKARALPTELWPLSRREATRSNPRQIRGCAQLSPVIFAKMVGLGRLELPTSRLSSARSNQLSYKPQAQAPPRAKPARVAKITLRQKARATRDIRPNSKTARARPGRKRNEGGEVPHFRPCRPVVPSDPIGGKPRLAGPGYRICQIMPAGLKDHP